MKIIEVQLFGVQEQIPVESYFIKHNISYSNGARIRDVFRGQGGLGHPMVRLTKKKYRSYSRNNKVTPFKGGFRISFGIRYMMPADNKFPPPENILCIINKIIF